MFSLDLPNKAPEDMVDIMFLPLVLFLVVLGLWFSQDGRRRKTGQTPVWWWLFFLPVVFGLWIGFRNLYVYYSYAVYRADMPSNRMLIAHWLSFLLPGLALGLTKLWQVFTKNDRSF